MFLEAVFVTTFLSGPLTSVCGFSTFEEKEIKVKTSNGEVSVMLWINGPDLSNSKDDTKKYPAVINFPWYPYLMKNDTPQPEDPKKELSRVRSCWGTNPSGGDYYVIHCRLSKEMQMYSDKTSSTCGVEIQNKVYEYITSQLPVDKNKILISGEWGLSNIALFSISKFPERYFGCLVLSIRAIGNAELTMRLSNKHFFLITYNYESSD
ncbi:MAG: hypothetical protein HY606_09125, partial [Planctomycetes bacterium]|nr:hypothetical protein [Planctomycetota bacterium]